MADGRGVGGSTGSHVNRYMYCMYFFPGLFNIHFFRKVCVDDVLVWSFGDTVKTTATDTYRWVGIS